MSVDTKLQFNQAKDNYLRLMETTILDYLRQLSYTSIIDILNDGLRLS